MALAMLKNPVITDLNLRFNNITPSADATELVTSFLQNKTLTYLNLSGNELGDEGLSALANNLRHNTTLTKLDLTENVGVVSMNDLALALRENNTLTALQLARQNLKNGLGSNLVKKMTNALMTSSVITSLDLSQNKTGCIGAQYVAEFLMQNKTLINLNFSDNNVGPEGASHIAAALAINDRLENLNLSHNRIEPKGAKDISDALKTNKTLATLNVYSNDIGAVGIKYFADALRSNCSLSALGIAGNKISANAAEELATAIKLNKTIRIVTFDDWQIYSHICKKIEEYLESNLCLILKISSIAKFVYTNKCDKDLILCNITKKDFEEFQATQEIIRMLVLSSDLSVVEAKKVVDYTHFFIETNYFQITGILDSPFNKLPLDILCHISSHLKLKDVCS